MRGLLAMPLSDEQLKQLGRVAVQSALLEANMASIIWDLVGHRDAPDVGRAITRGQAVTRLHELLKDLLATELISDEALADRIRLWAIDAKAAYEERNRRLHAIWLLEPGPEVYRGLVVTRKSVSEEDIFDGSASELEGLADRLKELQLVGRGLMQELAGAAILRPIYEFEAPSDRQSRWEQRST